jgi:ZIP family zinc transporter
MLTAILLTVIAGLSTVLGSFVILFIKDLKDVYLNIAMGFSAGVMIFISFTELLNESIAGLGYGFAILCFFLGMGVIYLIDVLIPHSYEGEVAECKNKKLKRCGMMVAIGITIHNFPEGIAVMFSSIVNIKLGIAIAIAIALHNIPEGIAVAMPIFYATKSRAKAFWWSFLSGVAEPIGALIALFFLYQYINETVLSVILAAVAGIMVFISFDELLPQAYNHKDLHSIILGIFAGMAVMAVSLLFV